ncbi:MAG: hypothetical protein JST63_19315 [Bacteroidetes bacterium]|nr:hypothetical protein [Bacteroidota bacterium]
MISKQIAIYNTLLEIQFSQRSLQGNERSDVFLCANTPLRLLRETI